MKYIWSCETPAGALEIAETDGKISYVSFKGAKDLTEFEQKETPLIKKAATQLSEYFAGKRKKFDLPLLLQGTPFQVAVWEALNKIPYGETRSYKDIAKEIGNIKAVRAVGMANNRNKIAIVIPCHRVIGSNGSLVGYAGGLDIKELLLGLEKQ